MSRPIKPAMFLTALMLSTASAFAQAPVPVAALPPSFTPQELDRIVPPVALYPDPLLAQVLAAATYASQIPDAARWADAHSSLGDSGLSQAMAEDQLPWDPSVQALLPFSSVLGMMAGDMAWTEELGNAFLVGQPGIMDAVQRMRHQAQQFGYLRSTADVIVTVTAGSDIEIAPVDPYYIQVPYYDPRIVFSPPRPGVDVDTAVRFGFGARISDVFEPWGWGGTTHLEWANHTLVINRTPWGRTWSNRTTYLHPYTVPRYEGSQPIERHQLNTPTAHGAAPEHQRLQKR